MKNIKFLNTLALSLFLSINLCGQKPNTLQIDILPVALVTQNGTGLQIALQRQLKNRIYAEINYGIIYDFIAQSGYSSPKANGIPIGTYTTEVSVKSAVNGHNFTLPDKSLIDNLNRLGFKQVTPYESYRLDNYGAVSVGIRMNKLKKWTFSPQLGIILGLANITESAGALTSNLGDNPFIGTNAPLGWIVFQVYARYWYIGATSKITIERRLKDNVYIGLPIGINYLVDRNFIIDDVILYTGLSLKIGF